MKKSEKGIINITFAIIMIFFFSGPALGTDVGGIISSDMTWDLEGSPYVIVDDVQVDYPATLTIEAGVEVIGSRKKDVKIQLWGNLIVLSNQTSMTTFDGFEIDRESGGGINIEYVYIKDCKIKSNVMTIKNSYLLGSSIIVVDPNIGPRGTIEKNIFNDTAIIHFSPFHGGGMLIIRNNIFKNGGLISSEGISPYHTIEHNSFLNTERVVIYVWKARTDEVFAQNNFWNTTDTNVIDEMIFDRYDDLESKAHVNYLPFLLTPHPDTPIIDDCPIDPNKTDPGICGCGFPDDDTDSDGTPDCNDSCPNDSAKTVPGICGCGVADTDSDSDGIPDCNDDCDNLIDSDGDGTNDCDDLCPNDQNKAQPGICGCSILDTDTDSDGTPDCNDSCPNDSAKTVPGICGCGVADTDSDSDGIPDCNDDTPLSIFLKLVTVGDLNGDNLDDLAEVTVSDRIRYSTNLTTWTGIGGELETIVTGDFNGDGNDDLAGVNSIGQVWYTTDLSSWTNIPGTVAAIVTGDLDGDGDDDIAGINPTGMISKIFYTTDLSTWTPIPGLITSIVTGDLDGDGDDDIAGINPNGAISKIFYTTDLSTWTPIPGLITLIITGDLDGDGDDDIAGINPDGMISKIFYTTDLSSWTPIPGLITSIVAGDFDGDLDDDIAGINPDGISAKIFYTTDLVNWNIIPGALSMITTGDLNADGRDDLAGIDSSSMTWYTTDHATWTNIP